MCVIPSVHRGGLHPGGLPREDCIWGGLPRRGALHSGGVCLGGVCIQRKLGRPSAQLDTMGYGTHPTRMHSCLNLPLLNCSVTIAPEMFKTLSCVNSIQWQELNSDFALAITVYVGCICDPCDLC